MLRYSLKKILRETGRSSKNIYKAFASYTKSSPPKNEYDPCYRYWDIDFSGDSYMINPHEFVHYSFKWKNKELAQYIWLASLRSYAEYKLTNDSSLDLFHSPVTEDTINKNRLLRVVDGKIRFYYEEVPTRRNKIWH